MTRLGRPIGCLAALVCALLAAAAPSRDDELAAARKMLDAGQTYVDDNGLEKAVADYTRVIEMKDSPADLKARALRARAYVYVTRGGKPTEAIADFTRVIELKDAPAE